MSSCNIMVHFMIQMLSDGAVICSESREQAEESSGRWRYELERRGRTCGLETEALLRRQKEAELEVAEEADDFHLFGLDTCRQGTVDRVDEGCWRWSCQAGGKRGRTQRMFMDVAKEEMKMVGATEEEARWRQITGCGNP